jgi:hypothetical protein
MPWPVHPNGLLGAQGGDNDSYRIERSLRFNSGDSAYLNRTLSTPTSQSIFTLSLWVKLGLLGTTRQIFGVSTNHSFGFTTGDALNLTFAASSALTTTALFRDPSAWYHIVWTQNGTSHTLYVNGVSVGTATATSNTFNTAVAHQLGAANTASYFNGYLTEINFIDGQALTPSSFGETDAITGRWKAKAYSGTYGTNGFYLKFADNSGTTSTTLGKDSSPNGNNWTPNNFSVTAGAGNDSLVDSPTNYGSDTGVGGEVRGNYCTLSAIDFAAGSSGFTLSDGNLRYSKSLDSGSSRIRGTIFVGSGKYYWEYNIGSIGSAGLIVGIASTQYKIGTTNDAPHRSYLNTGSKTSGSTSTSYGSSYTANDVIGLAVDIDAGTLVFYKNGTSQGTAFTDIAGSQWTAFIQGEAVVNCNFGQRPFAYTAPTGFKALCTTNLPTPTIKKPSSYFDALAYTGTGASNSISSLGFSPDLVWIKNRGTTTNHAIYDIVRGTQAQLSSNLTDAEVTSSTGLTAFESNGFTIGTSTLVNTSGTQYVSWAWDAGSSSVTNASGSITSTVRANPQNGISVVGYTGNGTAGATVGHGLGISPSMIIAKKRSTATSSQWAVGFSALGWNKYLLLNSTTSAATDSNVWNSAPTSSVFYLGNDIWNNQSGQTTIAYCFAEIADFSKFGSYVGNGLADGPFVWCGFRPRFVMIKTTGSSLAWIIYDTARSTSNLVTLKLAPNNSQEENGSSIGGATFNTMDILSNGFKLRSTNIDSNQSGVTFIFAAFAESPFKYARAR